MRMAFSRKERKGSFDRDKAAIAGLSQEQRKSLSEGNDITLANGELLQASQFRGPTKPGTSIVLSGDTAEQSIEPIVPVTVLIHEATFLDEAHDKAETHLHSTASGAARTALQCKAEHLILTHFSHVYAMLMKRFQRLECFDQSCSVTASNDGDRVRIDESGHATFLTLGENGWTQHNLSHH